MPENLPGVRILGRPIKPVAMGLCLLMIVTVVYNVLDRGVLGPTPLAATTAVLAGVAAALLIIGWWTSSQRTAEWGLLATMMTEALRGAFVALTIGPSSSAVWGSTVFAIIAAGSYMLETWDDPHHWGRRR